MKTRVAVSSRAFSRHSVKITRSGRDGSHVDGRTMSCSDQGSSSSSYHPSFQWQSSTLHFLGFVLLINALLNGQVVGSGVSVPGGGHTLSSSASTSSLQCGPGYYGSPVNGGNCTPCECNNHGTHCMADSGRCYCTTKGIVGDRCERCDTQNHYHGDPTNNGSCFYNLIIDYQFTFNISKKDDRHYTQINFKNSPPKADIDADFSIICSETAKMNITVKTVNQAEKALFVSHNCSNFKTKFYKDEYNFGVVDNVSLTTFYVYAYDFQPPLWIQISFSQYAKRN